jgi:hypothetical protein
MRWVSSATRSARALLVPDAVPDLFALGSYGLAHQSDDTGRVGCPTHPCDEAGGYSCVRNRPSDHSDHFGWCARPRRVCQP